MPFTLTDAELAINQLRQTISALTGLVAELADAVDQLARAAGETTPAQDAQHVNYQARRLLP